jgi:hypothetical protein
MEEKRVEELENCENCRFSFWAVPEKTLLCRRVPPVTGNNSFELGRSLFSQTHRSVWCVEWKNKGGPTWGGEKEYDPRAEKSLCCSDDMRSGICTPGSSSVGR